MRIGKPKMWSLGLAVLLALGSVARAQSMGEHRGPTSGSQGIGEHRGPNSGARSGRGELKVYFVDVEGGQSTLFVMPGGESLLVDTGSPDSRNPTAPRDASRIAAVCKLAGVTKIDNLVVTHYHSDHVGGLPQLVGMVPVGRFIDHGENREGAEVQGGASTVAGYNAYQKVLGEVGAEPTGSGPRIDGYTAWQKKMLGAEHLVVKPGDVLPVKAMKVEVVSGDGEVISKPLAAGGEQNAACAASPLKAAEGTENDRSLGLVITFGKLRILDLGDLTWAKERALMCPVDKLGKVDVYIVSHHGLVNSGSPALVDAIAPRVAIMDNGTRKGGAPATFDTIMGSSRLKDLWQLHTAEGSDAKHNVAEPRIANLPGPDAGNTLKLTGRMDGSISVTNGRTGETVEYPAP
jgi:beta-lactamase superfamily II metal-dependent hydrolase